jgi:allantoinase
MRSGSGQLVIRARRAVLPDGTRPATVRLTDGMISDVGPYDGAAPARVGSGGAREGSGGAREGSGGARGGLGGARAGLGGEKVIVLADDEVLLPGLVDTHVHINEPGRDDWEGFATATRAAAAGGITTIVDMPLNSIPPTTNPAALRIKRERAAGKVHVDVGFWGGAVPGSAGFMPRLHGDGAFGFKAFLVDSGVPEFPPVDEDGLGAVMEQAAALGSVVLVHAEDAAVIAAAPPPAGRSYRSFQASRPPDAEVTAIAQVINAAEGTGARAHVLHLSAADALPLLEAARSRGAAITVETCPHYLALAAEDVPDGATQFKCCPPIRERANRERLWQALRDGIVDCVVSDHSPCPPAMKHLADGDFGAAWGGISSVQLSLPVVWTQARHRGFSLDDIARWMAARPAEIAGVAGKGRIAPGFDADLVAFAPDDTFTVDPLRLHHRHKMTPYAGQRLHGVVRRTWLRGAPADGQQPGGRLLNRGERTR